MTEKEAGKLASESQNMVSNRYKKIGTERIFFVTDVTKNRETDSSINWLVLVSFKDEKSNIPDNSLVENISYFTSNYKKM